MCTFRTFMAQKFINFKHEHCICYFPQFSILQGNARMFGKNIDSNKVKVKAGMKHFFACAFENFYIAIWSYMKLEDVLEVLPMLISNTFLD